MNLSATGDIVLSGGAGNNASALIAGDSVNVSAANIILNGGTGSGSFAAIEAMTGSANVRVTNAIILNPGASPDADASILAPLGTLTLNAASCAGCASLIADPLGNTLTDQGLFANSVVLTLSSGPAPAPLVQVDNSIIYAATLTSEGGQANTLYSTSGTETTETKEEEKKDETQKSSNTKDTDNAKASKRKLPVCI